VLLDFSAYTYIYIYIWTYLYAYIPVYPPFHLPCLPALVLSCLPTVIINISILECYSPLYLNVVCKLIFFPELFANVNKTWSLLWKNQTSFQYFNDQKKCFTDQYSKYSIGNATVSEECVILDNTNCAEVHLNTDLMTIY
jgi:hypothetical protein